MPVTSSRHHELHAAAYPVLGVTSGVFPNYIHGINIILARQPNGRLTDEESQSGQRETTH